MRKYFLEWLRPKIEEHDDTENEFEEGYLDALYDVERIVEYGTFDDVIYVKLKQEYNIKGLNPNKEYEAHSVFGGEYFEIINDELGVIQYYERSKFDVLKVYNPYKKQYFTKNDIEKMNIKITKGEY